MFRTSSRRGYAPANRLGGGRGGGLGIRLIIGLVLAAFAVVSYFMSQEYNPVTGENQYLSLTPEQEIALGLQSAPELIREFGGLYPDNAVQAQIDEIGNTLVANSVAAETPWEWEFYVLDDPNTVNAFALPGGPVFITTALLSRFETEDEIAGVLSHEIVHVLARHSAQQIARQNLAGGLIGAVGVASGDASTSQTAAMVAQLITMSYGRDAEIQSDTLGVCLMLASNYDPNAMVTVMEILRDASGGSGQPEFMSTHPDPGNRIERIQQRIADAETCELERQ